MIPDPRYVCIETQDVEKPEFVGRLYNLDVWIGPSMVILRSGNGPQDFFCGGLGREKPYIAWAGCWTIRHHPELFIEAEKKVFAYLKANSSNIPM